MADKKPTPAAPSPAAPTRRATPRTRPRKSQPNAPTGPPPLTAAEIENIELTRAMAEKEAREQADFAKLQLLAADRIKSGNFGNPDRNRQNELYAEQMNREQPIRDWVYENLQPKFDSFVNKFNSIVAPNGYDALIEAAADETTTPNQAGVLNALAVATPPAKVDVDAGSTLIGGWPNISQSAYSSRRGKMGFSGCDINAMIRVPARTNFYGNTFNDERIFQIGTLQTISISTYNAKTPVKALGFKNPISIARGGRTIAGTMIFNQLNTHVLNEFEFGSQTNSADGSGLLSYSSGRDSKGMELEVAKFGAAQTAFARKEWDFSWDTKRDFGIPQKPSDVLPFDIVLTMINEAGAIGKIMLYDVDIIHDSQTLSVEDIYTEVQYQYIARDIDYFNPVDLNQAWNWEKKESGHDVVRPEDLYNRMLIKSYLGPGEAKESPSYSQPSGDKPLG